MQLARPVTATSGFTALELMITVAILAVFAAVAAPYMGDFIANARVRDASQEIRAALMRARSEAIHRNTAVEVRPTDGNWADGWQIKAGTLTVATTAALLNLSVQPSPASNITYRANGRPTTGAQTIVVATDGDAHIKPRCVLMDSAGRASVKVDSDFDATNGCG